MKKERAPGGRQGSKIRCRNRRGSAQETMSRTGEIEIAVRGAEGRDLDPAIDEGVRDQETGTEGDPGRGPEIVVGGPGQETDTGAGVRGVGIVTIADRGREIAMMTDQAKRIS